MAEKDENETSKKGPVDPRIPVPQKGPVDPRNFDPNRSVRPMTEQDRPDLRAVQAGEAAKAAAAGPMPSSAAAPVIKHVWTSEDTYADLAFKYYGSIKEPYWRLIYEHNKAIIGNHPNDIRVGLEIEIPPLPDELKKK